MTLKNIGVALAGILWLCAIVFGMEKVLRHEFTPGVPGAVSASWPSGSGLERAHDRPTLVMVAHPRCPCTRSSLGELAWILARCGDRMTTYVVFTSIGSVKDDGSETASVQLAKSLPGVHVLFDRDGTAQHSFGAVTSGTSLLYDRQGKLVFQGGITGSRGHSGDNAGRSAIVSLVNEHHSPIARTSVFGCSLENPTGT